jgi:GTP cyclohydrolase II
MIQHFASAPHTAIALALSSARDAIDGLPTFVKAR